MTNEVLIFTHHADESVGMDRLPAEYVSMGAQGNGTGPRWERFTLRASVRVGAADVAYEIRMDETTARRINEQLTIYLKGRGK